MIHRHIPTISKNGHLQHRPFSTDRATTSLTPYGTTFWALILAACGGGGGGGGGGSTPTTSGTPATQPPATQPPATQPPATPATSGTVSKSGYVYDGPVENANVYIDIDGDGRLDRNVDLHVGRSNKQGHFSVTIPRQHAEKRYIVDLTGAVDRGERPDDPSDDIPMSGEWLAPAGATVVSAVTHLIASKMLSVEQVQSAIPNFDPLHDNPYGIVITPAKRTAFEIAKKALPALTELVQQNRNAIEQNARDIFVNRRAIEDLKKQFTDIMTRTVAEVAPLPPPPASNTPPDAVDDTASTVQTGNSVSELRGNVRTNDSDAETPVASLRVTGVWAGGNTQGTQGAVGTALQGRYGTLTLQADGTYVYGYNSLKPSVVNGRDIFTYRIADTDGGTDTATLTITVNSPRNTPTTGTVTLTGLNGNSIQAGDSIQADTMVRGGIANLRDPDDPHRTITNMWQKQGTSGVWQDLSGEGGTYFTPDTPGTYRLKVTVRDNVFNVSTDFHSAAFTVTAPSAPLPPPRPQPRQPDVDDAPTAMRLDVSSRAIDENTVAARKLATVMFTDPDTKAEFLNNQVRIFSVDGVEVGDNDHNRFEIRNNVELWVKAGTSLNFELQARHEIVLRHVPKAGETRLDDVSFTLSLNDVNEAPLVMRRDDVAGSVALPANTVERTDTGLRFTVTDPDNQRPFGHRALSGDEVQQVLPDLSGTDGERFDLVEYTPPPVRSSRLPVPKFHGIKHYKLMAKAGQEFTPGETLEVTVGATDQTHGTKPGGMTAASLTVSLTVVAAASPPAQPSRQPDVDDASNGRLGEADIRVVDTTPSTEASALQITNLESADRIRIDMEYVWVKSNVFVTGTQGSRSYLKDVIYSPHDLSLHDNVLAMIKDYVSLRVSNLSDIQNHTYLTTRTEQDQTVPKAYELVEQKINNDRNPELENDPNIRQAFVIDETPSIEALAVTVTGFRPGGEDRLVFMGTDIYWQIKDNHLVFYNSNRVKDDNVLAVIKDYIRLNEQTLLYEFTEPTSDLFQSGYPDPGLNLHNIPLVRLQLDLSADINSRIGQTLFALATVLSGSDFHTDYFKVAYHRNLYETGDSDILPQGNDFGNQGILKGHDIATRDLQEIPTINNFEDGKDKILLSHYSSGDQIQWQQITENGQTNITIYNNTKDNPRSESQNLHIIAKIVNFTGTFDHNDFLLHDLNDQVYDNPASLENILLTEIT